MNILHVHIAIQNVSRATAQPSGNNSFLRWQVQGIGANLAKKFAYTIFTITGWAGWCSGGWLD